MAGRLAVKASPLHLVPFMTTAGFGCGLCCAFDHNADGALAFPISFFPMPRYFGGRLRQLDVERVATSGS